MSTEEDLIEDLRASYAKYGPLRKVVVTQFGIAGGETRKRAVPEWPEVRKDVADLYDHLRLKASDNIQAVKPASWWEMVVNEAAKELAKKGVKPGDVAKRLVQDFPLSEKRVLFYLRPEFKQPERVRAGEASGSVRAARTQSAEEGRESYRSSKERPQGARAQAPPETEGGPGKGKKEPYARGQSPTLRQNLVGEFTPSQMSLVGGLEYLHVPFKTEFRVPVQRWICPKCHDQYDEDAVPIFDKDAGGYHCRNDGSVLEQVQFKTDIFIQTNFGFAVALEVEGEGSSSKDDPDRERLLLQRGVRTWHIPNGMADRWAEEIAAGVKVFLF
jgi:hypothetical protein